MVNKIIVEQRGGPNYTEFNWQAPLKFTSYTQQNKIKRVVKTKQSKTKHK